MEERKKVQSGWATHYKFVKFKTFIEHLIPKQGISTWNELKCKLKGHVGIDHDRINIAVNNKLVFYQPDTLLEDIDIKKDDICFVMAKKAYEDELWANQQKEQMQKNMNEIYRKRNDPYFREAYQDMKRQRDRQNLYKDIVKQYSKWECLIALQKCRLHQVKDYLKKGEAKSVIERMQKDKIGKIISNNAQQVRKGLEAGKSPQSYGNIMKELGEQYCDFNELELKHQKYIQKELLGRELVPPRDILLEQQIASIIEQSQRQRKRLQNTLSNREELSEQNKLNSSLFSIHQLNKHAKTNLILQFFSHPSFNQIVPKLKGDKQKCRDFLSFIRQTYSTHIQLIALVEQCKEQIIIVLSEGQQLENDDDCSYYQLAQCLKRCGFNETEAINLAKASQNSLQKLRIFLEAGGIIKTYNFCAQDKISNFFNKEKSTLERIQSEQAYQAWKNQIASTDPQLFSMIMRNQGFVNKLRGNIRE